MGLLRNSWRYEPERVIRFISRVRTRPWKWFGIEAVRGNDVIGCELGCIGEEALEGGGVA